MDDDELVRQALDSNHLAFTRLVDRYTPLVYALCRARVWRSDVVPDLVQETFVRAWEQRHTLQAPDRFGAWLLGIARNLCSSWRRDLQNRQTLFSDVNPGGNGKPDPRLDPPAPDDPLRDDVEQLMACLRRLPLFLREPLVLRCLNPQLTYQQLAGLLNSTPAAINRRLTRARNLLRCRLRT